MITREGAALFYLFDFGTNISTLRTYYLYDFVCYRQAREVMPLRDDVVCRALRSESHKLRSLAHVFWASVAFMALAHLSFAFIFWVSLDPRQHPFRLAYFLPLLHLSRLLKTLRRTCDPKSLLQLEDGIRELSTLYNVLGASLETIPQRILQFHIVMELGEFVHEHSVVKTAPLQIPRDLLISLVASVLFATYSVVVAILQVIKKPMSLAMQACIALIAGIHTLASVVSRAMIVAALGQAFKPYISPPLAVYILIGGMLAWINYGLFMQTSISTSQGKRKWLVNGAHSFGLMHVSSCVGPMYVIISNSKGPMCLIWFTIVHIFLELLGIAIVLLRPGNGHKRWESPCSSIPIGVSDREENKYLTCHAFLAITFSALLVFLVSTMLLIVVDIKVCKNTRLLRSSNASVIDFSKDDEERSKCSPLNISSPYSKEERKVVECIDNPQLFLFLVAFTFLVIFKRNLMHHKGLFGLNAPLSKRFRTIHNQNVVKTHKSNDVYDA